jgi:hypothetical protein
VKLGLGETVLELHPRISVLVGLDDSQRAALVEVIRGLPRGTAVAGGVVEAHEVLFDLTDEVLDLFELADNSIDPVVSAQDLNLPTGAPEPEPKPEPKPKTADGDDPDPVRRALAALEASPAPQPSPVAESLAGELAQLDDELSRLEQQADTYLADELEAARGRLESRRGELAAAERMVNGRHDPDLVAALEAVHAEVIEAGERLDARGRRRREQAKAQYDAARAREDELLARLGHVSYTAFQLSGFHPSGSPRPTPIGSTSRLHAARDDVDEAEADLARLQAQAQAARREAQDRMAELTAARGELLDRVADLLGHRPGPDPVSELRAHRVSAPERIAARADLVAALAEVGVQAEPPGGGPVLGDEDLALLARQWLREVTGSDGAGAQPLGATEAQADPVRRDDPPQDPEKVEWYLLGRIAAQRNVSYVGSVPILIDRALDSLPGAAAASVLDHLEPVAAAVQILVVSDSAPVPAWAQRRSAEVASVVGAQRARRTGDLRS